MEGFPLRACHRTSMSHREHLGCGRFTSYKMITMSRTCRLQKCILIAVRVPAAWHGLQTMMTFFLTLVRRPTRSNKLISVSNAHCSQRRLESATMPLSA